MRTARIASQKHGADQVLWLLHDFVTEAGAMNFFVRWKNDAGEEELVTPPLDGTILVGVTRESVLQLARELGEFKVSERPFKIQEVIRAAKEHRLREVFCVGTAVIISPVKEINYKGEKVDVPIDPKHNAGPLSFKLLNLINDIQYGKFRDPSGSKSSAIIDTSMAYQAEIRLR
eukprot:CAMPEP_0202957334 /NCGR_PEP_ID=MMETSP1396-20130829/1759_1 /ASSEMBLY_ACC=CAM_ASM_000872 /TAXON_ID= /ORGANISM="Pseudokeronopsis sp., Strain Brazil" /LENGTH=173 /DNA_ID=CAMNT_0049674769 /DNA_START=741 /DNA_END=1260 /DNA_ORIENTATION=-